MVTKQLFAKLGVFVLLGLNVAAYWFFWPNYRGGAMNVSKGPAEKGETRLLPPAVVKEPVIPTPREIAPASVSDAIPLNFPVSAPSQNKPSAEELLKKLGDKIKEDESKGPTKRVDDLPRLVAPQEQKKGAIPGTLEDPGKRDEPMLQLPSAPDPKAPKPLKFEGQFAPIDLPRDPAGTIKPIERKVEVGSPLVPKAPTSPWSIQMETRENRTQVLARLQPVGSLTPLADFRFVCDRVEPRETPKQLVALGNVLFSGGGLRGECQSVTLSLQDASVLFEGHIHIVDALSAAQTFRSDRLVWGPVPSAPKNSGLVLPK